MQEKDRKAAIAAYKDREVEAGVYLVRCLPTDQVWIGSALDLSTIQNRLRFELRQGRNLHRSLQEALTAHGSEAFVFEVVDRLTKDDDPGYIRKAALAALHANWIEKLNGTRI